MPRFAEHFSETPWARVLTAYMWAHTPPWNAPKLSAVLGVQRNRVNNWIYYDIVPEIDTIIAVMARLDIPMSRLLDAYRASGQPVPPLLDPDPGNPTTVATTTAEGATAPREIVIPSARRGRGGGVGHRAGQSDVSETMPDGEAEGGETDGEGAHAPTTQEEWETMLAHTRQAMTLSGMPAAAIEVMLAHLEDTRAGRTTDAQRRLAEERQTYPPPTNPSPATPRDAQNPAAAEEEDTDGASDEAPTSRQNRGNRSVRRPPTR